MNKILALVIGLTLLFSLVITVSARSSNTAIPEKNGDYPDPEHPGIRVRVFVHEPKAQNNITSATCSLDNPSDSVDHPVGWHLPAGNWKYSLNVSSVPSSVSDLSAVATNAFNVWQGVQSKVTFSRTSDTTKTKSAYDHQNIIAWGRTNGNALAVTYTRYDTSTKEVVDVDTIFNQRFAWTWNTASCSNAYDAQDILTHETGHWMGLDDEYATNYANNTMYGYGSTAEIKKDTLTNGDTQGVQAIYP